MKDWHEKLKEVKWKVEICHSGEECWCRIIVPTTPVVYREEGMTVCDAGSISKAIAEHIVEIHNSNLENKL